MGERRKHKSLWDKEAEPKSFPGMSCNNNWTEKDQHPSQDSVRYHEISTSGSHAALKLRDHSSQPSLESIEKNPIVKMNDSFTKSRENASEGKEIGGENSSYQNMSPDLKHDQSLEDDRSHSRRFPGRGKSRSRSRTRDRCRSRSLSRGRERERKRVRGRSRSRSKSVGDARGRTESKSSGWSNRRSEPEKSFGRGPRADLKGDVSDSYHAEYKQFQNKSKNSVPCKNFVMGKCRWGDTCRFYHHFASDETSAEGTKHLSSDKDGELQPFRNRKPLCKYFAAGKCDRDNCRFSHEDLKPNSLEGGFEKVNDDRHSHGNSNKRNGSIRDDPGSISWALPQQIDNLVDKNNEPVRPAGSGSYGGQIGTTESVSKENTAAKQELLTFHGSELQNQDKDMNVEGQNNLQVNQNFFVNDWQKNVSSFSHIQQKNHEVVENASFHPDIIDETKGLKYATGKIMHQNGEQMPALNGAEMHQFTNLNLQSLIEKHQNAIQMMGRPETNGSESFPNLGFNEHSVQYTSAPLSIDLQPVAPVKNPVMFSSQGFENEHSVKNAVMDISNSTWITNSISNASGHDPMEIGRSKNEPAGPNNSELDHSGNLKLQQETAPENPEFDEVKRGTAEESKRVQNISHSETLEGHGKGDEIIANKDYKDTRLFKNSLIEFVKDILKPTWKEGRMSREVHKTIVKKVVDKITSTIQTDHIPKTQEKVEQYLSFSKPKIAKLVQAYVDRCLKLDS